MSRRTRRVGTPYVQLGGRQAQQDGGDVVVAAFAVGEGNERAADFDGGALARNKLRERLRRLRVIPEPVGAEQELRRPPAGRFREQLAAKTLPSVSPPSELTIAWAYLCASPVQA